MSDAARDAAIRAVLSRLDAAWRDKNFDGLDDCFDENAIIVGPTYTTQYATGRGACADSYREFARNQAIVEYVESNHQLHSWPDTAVYTFSWEIGFQLGHGLQRESGTDQLVLGRSGDGWKVVFRYIYFTPSPSTRT
jgi:ketosteroid isomerase-like protein